MSQENVEAVQDVWRDWSRNGIEGAINAAAADTVTYAFPGWVGKAKQD